jgi:hypothetical protein
LKYRPELLDDVKLSKEDRKLIGQLREEQKV